MRIVYVLTSLGIGGAERQALALAERMARRGHRVALLVLRPASVKDWTGWDSSAGDWSAGDWSTGLDRIHLNMRRTACSLMAGLAHGRRFVEDFHPDLLHSYSFHANIFARLLKPLVPRVAVVSNIHNVYEGGALRMIAYRLTDGLSRHTVAVSEAAAERFTRIGAVPRWKCPVISNGIDIEEFVPSDDRRAETRAQMGLSDESPEFVWIAVGRIAPAKDYPNLLRAFEIVARTDGNSRLWIAGDGPEDATADLESRCDEMGIPEAVRWVGPRRDMPALLDAADGFVSASAWEGMPLAIGEAMAMEKPVVATDVGGVRELVGGAGKLVQAHAPDALAETMVDVMRTSRQELYALGRAARERVAQSFNIESKAEEWEKLYRRILSS